MIIEIGVFWVKCGLIVLVILECGNLVLVLVINRFGLNFGIICFKMMLFILLFL